MIDLVETIAQGLHRAGVRRLVGTRPVWDDLSPNIQDAYRARAEDLILELDLSVESEEVGERIVGPWAGTL